MAILLKAIYRLNAIPIKILTQFLIELLRANWKFILHNNNNNNKKKPRTAKTILNNKRSSGGITMSDFKLYYRAIVIKTSWYLYNDRQVDQWNRVEDPEMNPHIYCHLIFHTGAKTIQWKKDIIFNKWCWHNWKLSCRRIWIDLFLSPCTQLKSKGIKELHIKPATIKLIEEKVGKTSKIWTQGGNSWTEHQWLVLYDWELTNVTT